MSSLNKDARCLWLATALLTATACGTSDTKESNGTPPPTTVATGSGGNDHAQGNGGDAVGGSGQPVALTLVKDAANRYPRKVRHLTVFP